MEHRKRIRLCWLAFGVVLSGICLGQFLSRIFTTARWQRRDVRAIHEWDSEMDNSDAYLVLQRPALPNPEDGSYGDALEFNERP